MNATQKIERIKKILSSPGCDQCDQIDGNYFKTNFKSGQQLKWDCKKKVFVCPRGHTETFSEAYRNEFEDALVEKLNVIAELI